MKTSYKSIFDLMSDIRQKYPLASYSVLAAFGIGYRIYSDKDCTGFCIGETNDTKNGRYKLVKPSY